MASAQKPDLNRARALLKRIPTARGGLQQRLLLAAAISVVSTTKPVVVGGTAEEYWAGGEYHPTDLDLCPRPTPQDERAFRAIGLTKKGRFWTSDHLPVAVEFPGSGDDIERTVAVSAGGLSVQMLSREEIYLDRVRQATAGWPHEDVSFDGAVEIALTNYRHMDWDYVKFRIERAIDTEPRVGSPMKAINRRVRTRVRRLLPASRS